MLLSLDITYFMLIKYYKILSNIYDREKEERDFPYLYLNSTLTP